MTRQEAKAEAREKDCYFGLVRGTPDTWEVDEERNPDYSLKDAPAAAPKGKRR